MNSKSFTSKRFRIVGVLTIAAIYFLILVGGIVRSTGSGMGCPDWPKCFGSWVPPTSLQELPKDYLEIYKEKRIQKNLRVGNVLSDLGFEQVAKELFAHPSQYIETEFNVTKTWIEYINRLIGVIIGLLIILTVVYAWPYRKKDPLIFWGAFLSFLVVVFQGWLGSLVVSTNLLPELVTIHMALVLVLIALLVYIVVRAQREELHKYALPRSIKVKLLLAIVLALSFVQIIIGTQVREEIDVISFTLEDQFRETWISRLGNSFYVHRSLSIAVVLLNALLYLYVKQMKQKSLSMMGFWILVVIFLEIVLGIILSYFAIPPFAQPLHLLLGTALFGIQFLLLIYFHYAQKQPYHRNPEVLASS